MVNRINLGYSLRMCNYYTKRLFSIRKTLFRCGFDVLIWTRSPLLFRRKKDMNKDKGIYLVVFLLTTVLLAVSKDTLSKRTQNTGIQSYDKFLSNYKYPFQVYTYSFSSQGKDMKMAYIISNPKTTNGFYYSTPWKKF